MTKQRKIIYFILLLSLLIFLDQASKTFLIQHLKQQPGHMIQVSPLFNLVYAWNYGISFGLFRNYYQYSNYAFLILNSFIILYLTGLTFKSKSYIGFCGLSIIIGGAIGNLIDRVFRGAVFDFLYLHYSHYNFPAFNLADSFITIGALFMIYEYILGSKSKKIT